MKILRVSPHMGNRFTLVVPLHKGKLVDRIQSIIWISRTLFVLHPLVRKHHRKQSSVLHVLLLVRLDFLLIVSIGCVVLVGLSVLELTKGPANINPANPRLPDDGKAHALAKESHFIEILLALLHVSGILIPEHAHLVFKRLLLLLGVKVLPELAVLHFHLHLRQLKLRGLISLCSLHLKIGDVFSRHQLIVSKLILEQSLCFLRASHHSVLLGLFVGIVPAAHKPGKFPIIGRSSWS